MNELAANARRKKIYFWMRKGVLFIYYSNTNKPSN